jgi:polyhydroxyalkanoate synthesis regulator phasin
MKIDLANKIIEKAIEVLIKKGTMNKDKQKRDWREGFEQMWFEKEDSFGAVKADSLIKFIQSLLDQQQAQHQKELEGLRESIKTIDGHYLDEHGRPFGMIEYIKKSDVLDLIKSKDK